MTTYFPPKVNTQYIFYASLVSQANTKIMQVNPTIATGDFKVSIDGGALNNLGTLPTVTPAAGMMVKFTLSTSEMNGANITVVCSDAAGSEWCDAVFNIQTTARQIDDLAFPTTSGRSIDVAATGEVGLDFDNINSTTTVTLNALTVTGALTVSNGIAVTCSTANRSAITATGNGTGSGIVATSGSGATGDGIQATAASTNGNGFAHVGTGTGAGFKSTGGATGNGLQIIGGGTSGDAILTSATSGHGATFAGAGTTKHGINATGGATTSAGIAATGGGTSGAGILVRTTSGHGVDIAATGTSMHGITSTGGNGGTSDGIKAAAGTGGVDIRGNITGNLVGTVSTVTTVTNQLTAAAIATGVWTDTTAGDFTTALSIGKSIMNGVALGTGLTINTVTNQLTAAQIATGVWTDTTVGDFTTALSVGKSLMNGVALGTGLTVNAVTGLTASNLDVAVSTRMATYTQPTGFLAAIFPGTVASTTNITAAAGVALTSAYDFAKGTVAMTESYAAQGATMTPAQALYQITQHLGESSIVTTTKTIKKRDGLTAAKTYTLNSATTPTSITEAT